MHSFLLNRSLFEKVSPHITQAYFLEDLIKLYSNFFEVLVLVTIPLPFLFHYTFHHPFFVLDIHDLSVRQKKLHSRGVFNFAIGFVNLLLHKYSALDVMNFVEGTLFAALDIPF